MNQKFFGARILYFCTKKFWYYKYIFYFCRDRKNEILMVMKMNVATRLAILTNLPEQGSVLEMISSRNIRKKIDFSSEEITALNLKEADGKISWTPNVEDIEVEFNDSETEFLRTVINIMDQKHVITDNILDFVELIQN